MDMNGLNGPKTVEHIGIEPKEVQPIGQNTVDSVRGRSSSATIGLIDWRHQVVDREWILWQADEEKLRLSVQEMWVLHAHLCLLK